MNEIVQVRMNNWASLIKARQKSGQTVKEWCASNDVSINGKSSIASTLLLPGNLEIIPYINLLCRANCAIRTIEIQ